ncbi:hypothetical protein COLO4_05191 [Corchorus olitorius]|uniref:Uncharacterized protein n=1 Tax=Corchorus olitorius TaxID=93759 RepID=A0A1R3KRK7_9ROSI|nr:hypothetical protein COLO4_05191 [Corchorus olitorius]
MLPRRDGVIVAGFDDGVLGGVGGGGIIDVGVNDKVDLKTMVEELDLPEIPSMFCVHMSRLKLI